MTVWGVDFDCLFGNFPIREVALLSDAADLHCNEITFRDIFPSFYLQKGAMVPQGLDHGPSGTNVNLAILTVMYIR